ncbi:MarR family winged helix-turn-helix transcriptional regulator [Qipengyuania sp. MTN3-11]|uniref:MarR family winged helix-turn-helix transcriptional regulator n=1 Tax=Qipengyuania sp. MTN3-11 TaxID=3056557 RepID=UPI0036F27D1C
MACAAVDGAEAIAQEGIDEAGEPGLTNEAEPDHAGAVEDKGGVGAIGDILGFHIRLAHGAVYRHFMETFAHLDLTQKQVSVMWLVDEHPGIAQTDLARRLQMDRATVMAIVNRLQARDFLERGRSQSDRRRQTLSLRPAGKDALADARQAIQAHEAWLKARFSEREVKQLIGLLERIHH